LRSEDFQKICLGIVEIKNYCQNHQCDFQCNFFTRSGCILMSGKPPSKWSVPATIIKGMNCIELTPIVIEEESKNESIKEGDQNANQ
jgi:hypothetical protein